MGHAAVGGRAARELRDQLAHLLGGPPDRLHRLRAELGVLAVLRRVLGHERETRREVLEVVEVERGEAVEGVELGRGLALLGELGLGEEDARLVRDRAQEVAVVEVVPGPRRRRAEGHEAHELAGAAQRHAEDGARPLDEGIALGDPVELDRPVGPVERAHHGVLGRERRRGSLDVHRAHLVEAAVGVEAQPYREPAGAERAPQEVEQAVEDLVHGLGRAEGLRHLEPLRPVVVARAEEVAGDEVVEPGARGARRDEDHEDRRQQEDDDLRRPDVQALAEEVEQLAEEPDAQQVEADREESERAVDHLRRHRHAVARAGEAHPPEAEGDDRHRHEGHEAADHRVAQPPGAQEQRLCTDVELEAGRGGEADDHELDPVAERVAARPQHRLELREHEHEAEEDRHVQHAPERAEDDHDRLAVRGGLRAREAAPPRPERAERRDHRGRPRALHRPGFGVLRRAADERREEREETGHPQELRGEADPAEDQDVGRRQQEKRVGRLHGRRQEQDEGEDSVEGLGPPAAEDPRRERERQHRGRQRREPGRFRPTRQGGGHVTPAGARGAAARRPAGTRGRGGTRPPRSPRSAS